MNRYITPTTFPNLVVLRLDGVPMLTWPERAEVLLLEYWWRLASKGGA